MNTKTLLQDGDISREEDELVFDPFNPRNREINKQQLQYLLTKYGVPGMVHNFNLYRRAFIHKSYVKRPHLENINKGVKVASKPVDCLSLKTKSNERLEFLGDGILECITKYYLYRRFPKGNEGFMTEKKIALVKNESIGRMAYEMGLNKWYILSRSAEEKKTRTNLKKLGCLFEAFLGALFLDFNKITIKDEDEWFHKVFVTGPGFQVAQIFVESIFEKHVNWVQLLQNDDNYKNILQVLIQKEFKTTPVYIEVMPHSDEYGYHMGVYLCLGQDAYGLSHRDALRYSRFDSFQNIQEFIREHGKAFVFLGESKHKIKKKAEQRACELAINKINKH